METYFNIKIYTYMYTLQNNKKIYFVLNILILKTISQEYIKYYSAKIWAKVAYLYTKYVYTIVRINSVLVYRNFTFCYTKIVIFRSLNIFLVLSEI